MINRFREIRERLGIGQSEFANRAGIKQSQVSEIENGKRNITAAIILSLVDNLNVNRKWLETGEGEMFAEPSMAIVRSPISGKNFKSAITERYPDISIAAQLMGVNPEELLSVFKKKNVPPPFIEAAKSKLNLPIADFQHEEDVPVKPLIYKSRDIPVYNDGAAASAVELYNDDLSTQQPAFYVSIPQFADCDFGKVTYGHSMYPTFENGSYLFMRRIRDLREVAPGEVYYIETNNLKVVKRLQFGNDGFNSDHFMAYSDNDEKRADGKLQFEPFPIFKENILALFIVKGAIKQNQN